MKPITKEEQAKTFTIALIGVSTTYTKILKRITAITQCRTRRYQVLDRYQDTPNADIIMVNVESVDAITRLNIIREHKTTAKHRSVIAIRSNKTLANDNWDYIAHTPFNPSRLIKLLDKFTIAELDYIPELSIDENNNANVDAGTVHSLSEFMSKSHQQQPAKKVLVVDDSEVIRTQLGLELKLKNYQAVYAASGEQALTLLSKEHFDLIFLDIVLPGLDGYSVCKHIKKDPSLKDMPVVMLTSRSSSFDKIRGTLAGCSTYVTKPVSHQQFKQISSKYLEN